MYCFLPRRFCQLPMEIITRNKSYKQVAPLLKLGNRCECHESQVMTIIKTDVSQQVWHAKVPSLLIGHECRAQVKICSPSPVTVTSLNEGTILQLDKIQANIQTKYMYILSCPCLVYFISVLAQVVKSLSTAYFASYIIPKYVVDWETVLN